MVGPSKILTVSYGTFSCTLEGFDDSFETMKAIAEYFRDLAADDRYFGAEPPTPDAEMLARIAEREVERRVEARLDGNNVVLRTAAPAAASLAAPEIAPVSTAPMPPAADPTPAEQEEHGQPEEAKETEAPADAIEAAVEDVVEEPAEEPVVEDASVAPVVLDLEEDSVAPNAGVSEITDSVEHAAENISDADETDSSDEDVISSLISETEEDTETSGSASDDVEVVATQPEDLGADVESSAQETVETVEPDRLEISDEVLLEHLEEAQAEAESESEDDVEIDDATTADSDPSPRVNGLAATLAGTVTAVAGAAALTTSDDADEEVYEEDVLDESSIDATLDDVDTTEEDVEAATDDMDVLAALAETTDDDQADEAAKDEDAETLDETVPAEDAPSAEEAAGYNNSFRDGPEATSFAAKFQRIRQVVSGARDQAEETEFLEDQHAEDAEDTAQTEPLDIAAFVVDDLEDDLPEDTEPEVEDTLSEEAADAIVSQSEPFERESFDLNSVLGRLAETEEEDVVLSASEEGAKDSTEAEAVVEDDEPSADVVAFDLSAYATSSDDVAEDLADDDDPMTDAPAPATDRQRRDMNASGAAKRARARVVKVKRADVDTALAAGSIEAVDETPAVESFSLDGFEAEEVEVSSLSDADELDLAAELEAAKVEARAGRAKLEAAVSDEDAVSRLMDHTESEMRDPETGRRQNAIAHLKAAVAATKAERTSGLEAEAQDKTESYRDDLAEAVRPRRPKANTSEIAEDKRPSVLPLKLVAEPRAEDEAATQEDATPVIPRRVARQEITGQSGGFTEFAESMGANSLPDLLEAAAAYMSFVEGRESFSRPMVMRAVASAQGEGQFSREDGLRSFGQLLREGKIQKHDRGQFTLPDDSRFNPETRVAGE